MTDDEIRNMPAGREMDALIAEKVFGIIWDETRCRICGWPIAESIEKGCTKEDCSMRPRPKRRADEHSNFSTDIAAAWLVVEKITAPPKTIEEARRAANTTFGYWFNDANLWACSAREAAEAICRAALLAVLEE